MMGRHWDTLGHQRFEAQEQWGIRVDGTFEGLSRSVDMDAYIYTLGIQVPSEKVGLGWVWRVQIPSKEVLGGVGFVWTPSAIQKTSWGVSAIEPLK